MRTMTSTDDRLDTSDRFVVGVAIVLHLGIGVFPLSASGLMAPGWFVAAVMAIWLAAAVAIAGLVRRAPRATPLVPVAVVAVWWVAITLGEQLLGWTA